MFPTLPAIDPTALAWMSFAGTALAAIAHARGNRLPGLSALFDVLSGQASPMAAQPAAPLAPAASVSAGGIPANHPIVQQVLAQPMGAVLNFLDQQKAK